MIERSTLGPSMVITDGAQKVFGPLFVNGKLEISLKTKFRVLICKKNRNVQFWGCLIPIWKVHQQSVTLSTVLCIGLESAFVNYLVKHNLIIGIF